MSRRSIDLGKIMVTLAEGVWNARTSYEILTAVYHNGDGYISRRDNIGVEPGTDESVWYRIVKQGQIPNITFDEDGNMYADDVLVTTVFADVIERSRQAVENVEQWAAIGDTMVEAEMRRRLKEDERTVSEENRNRDETNRRVAEENRARNESNREDNENHRELAESAREVRFEEAMRQAASTMRKGDPGKSAFEVAVEEGYVGNKGQWLASLKGQKGDTPDISIGTVTTAEPGTPSAATMGGTPEAPVLNLTIPKGMVGATPNITVGTVSTGAPGTAVVVEITGTAEAPVLNITIPQGLQGNTGSSVDFPFELVNNRTTDDATKGLTAAEGKRLGDDISQLDQEFKQSTLPLTPEWETGYYYDATGGLVSNSGSKYTEKIDVSQYSKLLVSGTVSSGSSRRTNLIDANDAVITSFQEKQLGNIEISLEGIKYVEFSFISTTNVTIQVVKNGKVYLLEQEVKGLLKDIEPNVDTSVANYSEEVTVASNRFNVKYPILPGSVQTIQMGTGYRYGLRYRDAAGTMIQDSGWSTDLLSRTPPAKAVVFDLLVEKTTGNFGGDKKAEVNENLILCSIEYYGKAERAQSSEWLWALRNDYRRMNVRSIRSVAHMGYYGPSGEYGLNRAEYYLKAAQYGFDYGECDIKFSSDGVPVCHHDKTFTDSVSGETITISEHTWAELQGYHYHDGRLSSFEEVLFNCKISGIGLYIDHLSNVNTQEKWAAIFSILAKYQMTRRVVWLCSDYTSAVQPILAYDKFATISILSNTIDADVVSRLNALKTDYNKVVVNLNQSSAPVTDIIQYSKDLLPGVEVEVWTIDSQAIYREYFPYVAGITSNRLSEPMISKTF